eukprot:4673261-Amphidinium_carterae.1
MMRTQFNKNLSKGLTNAAAAASVDLSFLRARRLNALCSSCDGGDYDRLSVLQIKRAVSR